MLFQKLNVKFVLKQIALGLKMSGQTSRTKLRILDAHRKVRRVFQMNVDLLGLVKVWRGYLFFCIWREVSARHGPMRRVLFRIIQIRIIQAFY